MIARPMQLNNQQQEIVQLGKKLTNEGMRYQGEVASGLLVAIVKDAQSHNTNQEDNKDFSDQSMSTDSFRKYLLFMGKRLERSAFSVQQDHDNPHAEEIAKGMLKTAEFVKKMSESRERQEEMQRQMQEQVMRWQQEAHEQRQKEQEAGQQKEPLSLGSSIGGLCDSMVKMLGAEREAPSIERGVPFIMKEIGALAKGLQDCSEMNTAYDARNTPAAALPEKGIGGPALPGKPGGGGF